MALWKKREVEIRELKVGKAAFDGGMFGGFEAANQRVKIPPFVKTAEIA
jgi:hypothetical protein